VQLQLVILTSAVLVVSSSAHSGESDHPFQRMVTT